MYSSSHRRRQKLSRFLIFADETLSRCAVNLVEVLVPERWQQRTHEHRRNNRQEKCQVIPHRKFVPNGDVQRHELPVGTIAKNGAGGNLLLLGNWIKVPFAVAPHT